MKLIKKIKSLFKRKKPIVSESDLMPFGRVTDTTVPTLDIDETHTAENGHPV